MIGVIAGDVIGSVHEHGLTKSTNFPLFDPLSRFTDDTVLTAATAHAILTGTSYDVAYREFGDIPHAGTAPHSMTGCSPMTLVPTAAGATGRRCGWRRWGSPSTAWTTSCAKPNAAPPSPTITPKASRGRKLQPSPCSWHVAVPRRTRSERTCHSASGYDLHRTVEQMTYLSVGCVMSAVGCRRRSLRFGFVRSRGCHQTRGCSAVTLIRRRPSQEVLRRRSTSASPTAWSAASDHGCSTVHRSDRCVSTGVPIGRAPVSCVI